MLEKTIKEGTEFSRQPIERLSNLMYVFEHRTRFTINIDNRLMLEDMGMSTLIEDNKKKDDSIDILINSMINFSYAAGKVVIYMNDTMEEEIRSEIYNYTQHVRRIIQIITEL